MVTQSFSTIFKSDLIVWNQVNKTLVCEIINKNDLPNLLKVTEIILSENDYFEYQNGNNINILILSLYGTIRVNENNIISSRESFTIKSSDKGLIKINNELSDEKADILILEFRSVNPQDSESKEDLIIHHKNTLKTISEMLDYPNHIGLFDGRKEHTYQLSNIENSIFGMVINGAFEFQNRLMETRDAIILHNPQTLEFEALSENALILLFEI